MSKNKVASKGKSKVVSAFVGLKSRRERRLEAKENKTEFEPQYNGNEPYRANSKAVGKIIWNDAKRKEKLEQRGVLN